MLKEYVNQEFLDLPEKLWAGSMVIGFIIKAIEHDSDVYDEIVDISKADLYQHMAEFDDVEIERERKEIQKAFLVNAKNQINLIIEDIEADLEGEDESEEQRLEGISFDNQRLM